MRYLEYREDLTRGSAGFPLAYYHVTPTHPRYNMPPHWQDEYEINRVLQGELLLILNREELRVKQGEAVFVNSGFLHSGTPKQCHYECIVFDMDFYLKNHLSTQESLEPLLNQQKRIRSHFPAAETAFQDTFRTMAHALSGRQTGYTLITAGALFRFLGHALQENRFMELPENNMAHAKKFKEFKRVLNYIALHYTEPLSLGELAGCAHMNPNYFCRFFREMTRKSPIEYLNYYRVECACEKLCMTNDSILSIALDCGFNDVNYFIKVFKKYKGTTPLQYLKHRS